LHPAALVKQAFIARNIFLMVKPLKPARFRELALNILFNPIGYVSMTAIVFLAKKMTEICSENLTFIFTLI